ncbi:MAG: CDP-alcohol phosphatidyltransferase family protein [Clostridia bacterium]|nr:CDP-alcohol phosphatidyltransferase family protein [Clostridia bacterium]
MSVKAGAAHLITGTRSLCSIALLFCPAFSPVFFALYVIAGLSDMIDGPVARKTHTVSEFGAKLDTAADFVFVVACLWKLLPKLSVPLWLWLWIGGIALIKAVNILSGYICQKMFVVMHTLLNKITGILLFILPLTLRAIELKHSAPLVCAAATFAAVQEGHFIRTRREILED